MVRLKSVHSHIVVSVSGCGRTLIGGRAVDWRPGQVLLAPVGRHHAFEIKGNGPWTLAWVFFDDAEAAPALRERQAELIEADASDFASIVKVLTREGLGAAQASMMEPLVSILETSVRRLFRAEAVDQRLWRLWETVESDLARDWSVAELARTVSMSEEHLRRLCQKCHQRSPIEHVTDLRMRRASTMLRSTSMKIDEIAQRVGYGSVYSFSVAFSRWCGVPPGRFRRGGTG